MVRANPMLLEADAMLKGTTSPYNFPTSTISPRLRLELRCGHTAWVSHLSLSVKFPDSLFLAIGG